MIEPHVRYIRYVPLKYVNSWHACGWMLGHKGQPIYDLGRGGQHVYMMVWLCDCPLKLPGDLSVKDPDGLTRADEPSSV